MKPRVETHGMRLSNNPSKNYFFHLLYRDIQQRNPSRSLEAGMGELRNYWMYPGDYVGIGTQRDSYFAGLGRGFNRKLILERGPPVAYLMRLESDLSFLGLFDLCVCTNTIMYVDDQIDVATRLAARVAKGGDLILDDVVGRRQEYLAVMAPLFESIELVYWGYGESYGELSDQPALANQPPTQRYLDLFNAEMNAPNVPEGHRGFYLHGRSKRESDPAIGTRPELIEDHGLLIVKPDIPRLFLGNWRP